MARRQKEVLVEHIVGELYRVWAERDVADKVRAIEGVREVYPDSCGGKDGPRWNVWLDPRYHAEEVIAEVNALGKESNKPVTYLEKVAAAYADALADHVMKACSGRER